MRHLEPMPSRSPGPQLFGKRTHDTRTKVSDTTKAKLPQVWRSLGYTTEAHFLADLIEIRVCGVEHIATVQRDRLLEVAGIRQKKGSE